MTTRRRLNRMIVAKKKTTLRPPTKALKASGNRSSSRLKATAERLEVLNAHDTRSDTRYKWALAPHS